MLEQNQNISRDKPRVQPSERQPQIGMIGVSTSPRQGDRRELAEKIVGWSPDRDTILRLIRVIQEI